MPRFKQDDEETPVLFRVHREYGIDEVVAVFPCDPADLDGQQMTCYAHFGQHSGCGFGWYQETRPAKPEEYADLKQELEGAPYGYSFRIYTRITATLRDRFREEVNRLNRQRKCKA
jgi:hypothetical protein